MNKGLPARIRSSLEIKLTAPDFVLGGKNSREKNLSLLSHLDFSEWVEIIWVILRIILVYLIIIWVILTIFWIIWISWKTEWSYWSFPRSPRVDFLCKSCSEAVHVDGRAGPRTETKRLRSIGKERIRESHAESFGIPTTYGDWE